MLEFDSQTRQKLQDFENLLKLHNSHYNLIGSSTMDNIWQRHILDCAQISNFIADKSARILDIGSGAGFPGMILAILGYTNMHLIDRNRHKCDFLKIAARRACVSPIITQQNMKEFIKQHQTKFTFITSRAVAPLCDLLPLCLPLINKKSHIILLKGQNYKQEWQSVPPELRDKLHLKAFASQVNSESFVLNITLQ